MAGTAERNGVLLFVAPESQSITVIGDRDAHERCGEAFWTAVVAAIRDEFRAGLYTEGIVAGVRAVGDGAGAPLPAPARGGRPQRAAGRREPRLESGLFTRPPRPSS